MIKTVWPEYPIEYTLVKVISRHLYSTREKLSATSEAQRQFGTIFAYITTPLVMTGDSIIY